jgi:hypothetical protein
MKIVKSEKTLKIKVNQIGDLAKKAKEAGKLERNKELEEESEGINYPEGFDLEHFATLTKYQDRVKYCNSTLTRIKGGSSRTVYKLDKDKVLKLAHNSKGIAQNDEESDGYTQEHHQIVTKVFAEDEKEGWWIIAEYAEPLHRSRFESIIGIPFNEYAQYLNYYARHSSDDKKLRDEAKNYGSPEIISKCEDNDWVQEVVVMARETNKYILDLAKLDAYGLVKRNGKDMVVIVDYGLTNPVAKTKYNLSIQEDSDESYDVKNAYTKVYMGGKLSKLKKLTKNFKVYIPHSNERNVEGSDIGHSAFKDKNVAYNHSKQENNNQVLPLYISPEAKIYRLDSQGNGLRATLTPQEILMLAGDGYDVIMDTNNRVNTEYIILKSDKVFSELELNDK